MGEDVTDMATTTSQLQAKLLALTGGKVDIMLDANTFKNTTQILREMAGAWEDMNDIQRASALELMGGKRQANTLSALIQNFDTVEEAIEASAKSAGSALKENERYLDSIQGRLDQFNNALQSMWNNVLDDDLIKFIVQAGTELIKIVDNVGVLRTLIIGIGTYLIQKNFKGDLFGGLFNAQTVDEARDRLKNLQADIAKLQKEGKKPKKIERKQNQANTLKASIDKYDELSKQLTKNRIDADAAKKALDDYNESLAKKYSKKKNQGKSATAEETAEVERLQKAYDGANDEVIKTETALKQAEVQAKATGIAGLNAGNKIKTGFISAGKAVWKFAKEMAMSMAYTMAFTAIFEAIGNIGEGLAPLFDKIIETPEELQEKLSELENELSSVESELSSLQSELKDTDERIEELMSQGSLTFVEQEELNKLKSVSSELKAQIDLQENLRKSMQQGVNSASVEATNAYLDTSFMSEQTRTEKQEKWGEIGEGIGQTVGTVGGAVFGAKVLGSIASIGGPLGTAIGIAAGSIIGGIIGTFAGEGLAGAAYDSEQTVGEAMDSMLETRAKLKKEQDTALAENDIEAYNEATEALRAYDAQMAKHISQIQQNYNAMDWETASPEDRKEMMEYADWLDKYNISMGTAGAKSNAIARIFGDEASDELKNIKTKIEEAAKVGNDFVLKDILTEEEYQAVLSRLSGIGVGVGDVASYFEDEYKAEVEAMNETSTESAVKEVANLTSGVKALKDAFNELRTEGKVSFDTLLDLKDTFGDLDQWSDFITTMSTGTATMDQMTKSARLLAEEFVSSKINPNGLIDPEEYLTYINGLEALGVNNAKEFFNAKLQEEAVKAFINGKYKTLRDAEKAFSSDDYEVKIPENLIKAAKDKKEADKKKKDVEDAEKKYKKQVTANKNAQGRKDAYDESIKTIKKYLPGIAEDKFNEMLEKYSVVPEVWRYLPPTDELKNAYKKAKSSYQSGDTETYQQNLAIIHKYIPDLKEENLQGAFRVSDEIPTTWDQIPVTKEFQDAYKKARDAYINGIDVPPITAEVVTEANVSNAKSEAEKAEKAYQNALKGIGLEIDISLINVNDLIDDLQSAYDTLSSAAKEYAENGGYVSVDTLQTLLGLEPKYIGLLYNEKGQLELNTESIQRMTQARIMEMAILQAKSYLNDLENAAIDGNVDQLTALTKATYIATDAEWRFVDSQLASIKTKMMEKGMSEDEADQYVKNARHNIESMKKLAETTAANINNTMSSSGNTATKEAEDAFQKLMDYWDNRISANQAKYDQIQNDIDFLESQGKMAAANYYRDQIDLLTEGEESKEEFLKAKLQGAKDRLRELKEVGKEGSDEWWEAAQIYNDTLSELDDVRDTVLGLQDAIGNLRWYKFEELNSRIDDTASKLETIRDLIAPNGEEDWFDDEGNWTEKGVASLGGAVQLLEYYKSGLNEASKALKIFKSQEYNKKNAKWFVDNYGIHSEQEYYDYLQKLTDEQYNYASSVSDTEQDITGMWESQVDAVEEYFGTLIESYNDYIDSIKEALDAERDLYDFKKNVQKQSKDIAALERRIASLSGSTNASDIAERRKLEEELYNSRESLNDTYYEHSMDSQQNALDAEAQAYEETMNRFIENLRTNLELAQADMGTFMEGVAAVVTANAPLIKEQYESLGIALDGAIIDPWTTASSKIEGYTSEKGLGMLNSWVSEGGLFDTYATGAKGYLESVWTDTTVDPNNAFENAIVGKVNGIKEAIRTNVEAAKGYLKDLADVKYTSTQYVGGDAGDADAIGSQPVPDPSVKALQEILKNVYKQNVITSGIWDGATATALKNVQKSIGVSQTGRYNSETASALKENLKKRAKQSLKNGYLVDAARETAYSFKVPVAFHAKGTTGTERDEWAIDSEPWLGDELVLVPTESGNLSYMRKGTGVVPADLTANLMEWGQFTPDSMNLVGGANVNMINNAVNKPEFNFTFDALVKAERIDENTLPEVKKFVQQEINSLVKQMNYAIKGKGGR